MVQNIVRIAHVMELEEEKECVARVAKRVVKDEEEDSSRHDKTHNDTTQHDTTHHDISPQERNTVCVEITIRTRESQVTFQDCLENILECFEIGRVIFSETFWYEIKLEVL